MQGNQITDNHRTGRMNTDVDLYLVNGCGRCSLGGTLACKVNSWREELQELRRIVLDSGLTEELKWGVPCYTFLGNNVAVVAAFRDYCAISFFKGALLKDAEKLLEKPGENTQAARLMRFTDVRDIVEMEPAIDAYIREAVEVERAGLRVEFTERSELVYPEEFQQKLNENPALKAAFERLTPGRQRTYVLYFSSARQSKTRASRVEKCVLQILDGKGLKDT